MQNFTVNGMINHLDILHLINEKYVLILLSLATHKCNNKQTAPSLV